MNNINNVLYDKVPFYSQIIDRNENIFSETERIYWSKRSCGIASIRMVIDAFRILNNQSLCPSQSEMILRGIHMNAYCQRGWIHKKLLKLAEGFGLDGQTFRNATIEDVRKELDNGKLCIISATICFLGGECSNDGEIYTRGGHMSVVLGYGIDAESGEMTYIIVHHPSSEENFNWRAKKIAIEKVRKSFSGAFMSFCNIQN